MRRSSPRRCAGRSIASVVAFALCAAPATAVAPGLYELGGLPGGQWYTSRALQVSADGRVVVGETSNWTNVPDCCVLDVTQAFRWEDGELLGLEPFVTGVNHERSGALAVSQDGSVVTGFLYTSSGWQGGFLWEGETVSFLGELPGGVAWSSGNAISDDGSVVAGHSPDAVTDRAFRWDAGTLTNLGTGVGYSYAYGLSGDGSVAVGYQLESGVARAKRWDGAVMSDLPSPLGAVHTVAYGISANASVIVGESHQSAGPQAVRWHAGGTALLGTLPGETAGRALDASADGAMIVGWSQSGPSRRATIWDADGGLRALQDVLETDFGFDLTHWTLTDANAISDDGNVIVGTGINPEGRQRGWIAVLVDTGTTACTNGLDDDGDGSADDQDPGCFGAPDDTEHSPSLLCDDGVDNDGDGAIDWNGIDLDGNGSYADPGEAPPDLQCVGNPARGERQRSCGLGFELALLLPLLLRPRHQHRAAR